MPPSKQKYRNSNGNPKKKRKRTILTIEQVAKLETSFIKEIWPSRAIKINLARSIAMSEHFVCVWFQNRRARMKREDEGYKKTCPSNSKSESNSKGNNLNKQDRSRPSRSSLIKHEVQFEGSQSTEKSEDSQLSDVSMVLDVENTGNMGRLSSTIHNFGNGNGVKNEVTSDWNGDNSESDVNVDTSLDMELEAPFSNVPSTSSSKVQTNPKSVYTAAKSKARRIKAINVINYSKPVAVSVPGNSSSGFRKILPLDTSNGSGEPDNSIQSLLNLTKTINNQMNWGTFGMTCTDKTSRGLTIQESTNIKIGQFQGMDSISMIREKDSNSYNDNLPHASSAEIEQISDAFSCCTNTIGDMESPNLDPDELPSNPPTLFRAIVNMIAVVEGGIVPIADPEYDQTLNDVLYGIRINGSSRLIYEKDNGLDLIEDVQCSYFST